MFIAQIHLVNNLWIGTILDVLMALMIPEQLLISWHYPQCYIFKLFFVTVVIIFSWISYILV